MLRILVLITALFGTMASAGLTPRDMRQIAYDGDIELMEATFARLHQESIDGDLPYDTFRWLVSGLIVSHPDVLAFSERWINAYPDSAYANTVRAFQLNRISFTIRGHGHRRQTPVPARAVFASFQRMAMDMALKAYAQAPDLVPASDAVFVLNMTSGVLDTIALDKMRLRVLSRTHDLGTLRRSLDSTNVGWGGGGGQEIYRVCENFAKYITEVENYDTMTCTIHHINLGGAGQNAQDWAHQALGYRSDEILTYARARRAVDWARYNRQENGNETADDAQGRADVIAYLEHEGGASDRAMTRDFLENFHHDDDSRALIQAINIRTLDDLNQAMKADPLNLSFLQEFGAGARIRAEPSTPDRKFARAEELQVTMRRVAAQPYHYHDMTNYALGLEMRPESGRATIADYIYVNAILHSNHATSAIIEMLSGKLRLYSDYKQILRIAELTGRTDDFDYELIPYPEFTTDVLCPIKRLSRLYAKGCDAENRCQETGLGSDTFFLQSLAEIEAKDICIETRNAPLADMYYTTADADLIDIYTGI